MIVVSTDGSLRLIEQEHHAHLTGALAARMPFGALDHAAFVAAARVHDNGWREADATPTVDRAGRPHTFSSAPDKTYEAEIGRASCRERVESRDGAGRVQKKGGTD